MKLIKACVISIVTLLMFNLGIAGAGKYLYEINGTLEGSFSPVVDDATADLLNVSKNAINNVSFTLKLIINADDIPYVENDNSILQQVIYRDAIIGGAVDLNGVVFEILRQPLSDNTIAEPPPANTLRDETRIELINFASSQDQDAFSFRLLRNPRVSNELFSSHSINNSSISLYSISFMISGAAGLFSDTALPTAGDALNPVPSSAITNISLFNDGGSMVTLAQSQGTGGNFTFNITLIPEQIQTIVLSDSSAHTVRTGYSEKIYGCTQDNTIIIQNEADAKLMNFPGSNTIIFESRSELFSVNRSGATVFFSGPNRTKLVMPATTSPQHISFIDKQVDLMIRSGHVQLGDQEINLTSNPLDGL